MIHIPDKCNRSRSAAPQPSDFSSEMDEQKTILRNRALFSAHPSPTENHKTTIIPLEVPDDFFGGRMWEKATLFQRLLFPHPHPLKNRCNSGGDDRQVSQNGMPFCTGCTLFGHILNLQGSTAPLDPSARSPKNETAKHPLEVSPFHFRIRWEIYPSHFGLCKQISTQTICSPCVLYHRQIVLKSA